VQQHAHAVLRQAFGRQQVPGQVTLLARVGGPVDVHVQGRGVQALADGFGETGQFLRAFFLMPQQHQECTQLSVFDLFVDQHAHGFPGFFAGQAAGATFALAENANELGKRVLGGCFGGQRGEVGHMQLVGLGRPASLAASLAGVPLNRRLRCMLLPFSGPSFSAVYLISGRVAGDSWNSS